MDHELARARVAFRGVSRRDDSRTVRACLIPPGIVLAHSAPYLAFVPGREQEQAACLAILNSLPFDWQVRQYIEVNLSFFILEAMAVPILSDPDFERIALDAARLSCRDERFATFANQFGLSPGDLEAEDCEELKAEIDARIARAWSLAADDLSLMFEDFSLDAVPMEYRDRVLEHLAKL